MQKYVSLVGIVLVAYACSKSDSGGNEPPPAPAAFQSLMVRLNEQPVSAVAYNIGKNMQARFSFTAPVDRATAAASVSLKNIAGNSYNYRITYANNDSTMLVQPDGTFDGLTKYRLSVATSLKSTQGVALATALSIEFISTIDSSRKFPAITDDELLTKVQQQTFKYFWDFAHPVSFLARERSNGDNNVVTSGGSGFGIMAIITGVERGFVIRAQAVGRLRTMVTFLKNTAVKVKGAFPHWLNGATGAIIPFSSNDNGADLVETSYLIQGLLCARQYFSGVDAEETALRADINAIWNGVDWNWFRRGGQNVLYWHYSDNLQWAMNLQVRGWNECLITYVLAASAPVSPMPKIVYDNGWANNGGMVNNRNFYGYPLSLGPDYGGPLFFSHYSFLGINPNGLTDAYANYATQVKNHTLINYQHCRTNNANYFGYSDSVWGLTASDIPNGYTASSPTNDVSVIAPTAALSSFPYTPVESMKALKFFYYVLGDKLWKEYGFIDAFSLRDLWYAGSFLAIDQGPIIVMIENYRSGLLWNLFTSCPEVKTGMRSLGFTAPYL